VCQASSYSFRQCVDGEFHGTYLACTPGAGSSTVAHTTASDGGGPDAGADGGGLFSCAGETSCSQSTSFCFVISGSSSEYQAFCDPLPAACLSNATCACLQQNDPGYLSQATCSGSSGQLTVISVQ